MSKRTRITVAAENKSRVSNATHATENQLIAAALNTPDNDRPDGKLATTGQHVDNCPQCTAEVNDLQRALAEMRAMATCKEEVSSPRLTRQRTRILCRIGALIGTPARVLQFPGIARPTFPHYSTASRRSCAAAAAGLVVGIIIGQLVNSRPNNDWEQPTISAEATISTPPPPTSRRFLSTKSTGPLGDEELMAQLEQAVTAPRVPTLVALDELTPRLRDVLVDVR